MTIAAALHRAYLQPLRAQISIGSFQLPGFFNHCQLLHHASTATFIPPSSTASTSMPESEPHHKAKRRAKLSKEQQRFLDSALRVNQAGELAATLIYSAQTPPIVKAHPHLRSMMQHMYAQEAGHLSTFNHLLARHRVRPSAMYPIWKIAAIALGWGTAMMGREAAMACTEAVETEIGEHYNNQVRELLLWTKKGMEDRGEEVGEEVKDLVETMKRVRDEELEHLDTAVEEDAKKAEGYELLNQVVRGGCKGAIWISERI